MNGLDGVGATPESGATEKGESWRFCGWLGKLSNIPLFVLILKINLVFRRAPIASPSEKKINPT